MHSVRDFIERAFAVVGVEIAWRGDGVDKVGINARSGKRLVSVDPRYFRPTEVEQLQGDATKAREKLGWAASVSFADLVAEMVQADLIAVRREADRRARHD